MPNLTTVNIAKDFSTTPAGRRENDHGPNSGETFRKKFLVPKLREAIESRSTLSVVLDGTAGYPASFLDEAFGGLIREDNFQKADLDRHLDVKAEDDVYKVYKKMCQRYIDEAESA